METLNYIGSKKTLISNIIKICNDNIPNLKNLSFADLFSGTGTVGYNMNKLCKKIIGNDLEYYSYIINCALLLSSYSDMIQKIIDDMNNLEGVEGLIFNNYSNDRMFFTNDNAKKADAIRLYLNEIYNNNIINDNEFNFLLASIITSVDKVANTSVVYGAFLKEYKKAALKPLQIKPIHMNIKNNKHNKVYHMKMEDLIVDETFDIVYLDPPYNQRQYSANYSPLNYIAQYEDIELTGKTGLIKDYNKSNFCKKTTIKETFINAINNIKCKYLILSYNNEGLMSFDDIKNILLKKGDIKLYKIEYNKFKAQQNVNGNKVYEYIWFVDTTNNNNKFEEINMDLIK
jgi:adenine-specific DNA-methyltransferase